MGYINVVIAGLYYFITNGACKIYIAGLDMSEHKFLTVDKNNDIWIEYNHSYGVNRVKYLDYGLIDKGEMYKLMGSYALTFKEFYEVSRYAKKMRTKIINLNPDSLVDCFQKTDRFIKK